VGFYYARAAGRDKEKVASGGCLVEVETDEEVGNNHDWRTGRGWWWPIVAGRGSVRSRSVTVVIGGGLLRITGWAGCWIGDPVGGRTVFDPGELVGAAGQG
jgi:hypothetical protein